MKSGSNFSSAPATKEKGTHSFKFHVSGTDSPSTYAAGFHCHKKVPSHNRAL